MSGPRDLGARARARVLRTARRRLARARLGGARLPVSRQFGFDRGQPVDRYYIEQYLGRFACHPGYVTGDIQGRVLEIGGREYADRFGITGAAPAAGITHRIDVLHEGPINPEATIFGDLADPATLPAGAFDCIIATQVLPVIWNTRGVLANLHAALDDGGALLMTVPGITRSLIPDRDHWGDFWRFTAASAARLAQEAFPGGTVDVDAYGNLQAATFFLHGYAAHELSVEELELRDPAFEVTIGVRARKARPE